MKTTTNQLPVIILLITLVIVIASTNHTIHTLIAKNQSQAAQINTLTAQNNELAQDIEDLANITHYNINKPLIK